MMKWPGHGLAPHMPSYQFVEAEYMKADEYDALLTDPLDFAIRYYTPRIYGTFTPFQKIDLLPLLLGFGTGIAALSQMPDIRNMLLKIEEAGNEMKKWSAVVMDCNRTTMEAGFPPFRGGACFAPFDIIGDLFRGTSGVSKDMFRQPDKLQQAMQKLTPILSHISIEQSNMSISPFIFMPLHKGDDTFMSDSQFETFYWPTLRQVCLNLINEGLVPQLFAEGKYTKRLKQICDLPRGSAMWIFDQTDMAKAKETLGYKACIAGNVPTSLMVKGQPADVKLYCRNLIETCGKGGGYILMGGADIDEGNLDNLHAMTEAAKEYGNYG
jgi:uroporphyrinogen-III decarboxylase